MQVDGAAQSQSVVKLDNYRFSGLDSSLVGALKSVADYYELPLTSSWIYGMTGHAFLHVLVESMDEPNGGPPVPEVLRLMHNTGLDIEGIHIHAEGEAFTQLQAQAWDIARQAIAAGQPVFAKNIDIRNQFSVVYAYDDIGYYRYNWHTGYEHSEDVIPWNQLGLSLCPCIHCTNSRQSSSTVESDAVTVTDCPRGLISLHWGRPNQQTANDSEAFKQALEFVIERNEKGSYEWAGKTYLVGAQAYERWLTALTDGRLNRYYFSLFIEILNEARSHALRFLSEMRERLTEVSCLALIDELTPIYTEVADNYAMLKDAYPYTEPPEHEVKKSEWCAAALSRIMTLERAALNKLRELHSVL
ncbi:hypothetical protein [Paenibacillus albus]|uniref:Uncharacterized protein n=1 Tax=Paenibacillus albus TaxID=2495582 RepID=A0A3Q8X343_9BACL|nr:hypothetical protein [Paenibacillus albus]AZN39021.1 hypothetical protein EJC50_04565 [Paenibacillus albus]